MKKQIFNLIDRFYCHTNPYYNFLTESQWWSKEELLNYQFNQLLKLSDKFNLGIKTWEDFYKLPLMTKDDARKYIPTDKKGAYMPRSTSGSTGKPLLVYRPTGQEGLKPAVFLRTWNWIGRQDEWVVRLTAGKPQWAWYDWWQNIKPMNYRTVDDTYIKWIHDNLPFLIHGMASAIRHITDMMVEKHYFAQMKRINVFLQSEDIHEHYKHLIGYWGGVYQGYGLSEVPTAATDCGYHRLHVNMETSLIEIINGEIVATDLQNFIMPIIRYRTGDLGRLKDSDCKCGIAHDILYDVQGRRVDYYSGPEVKKPIGWWLASPIANQYLDVVKAWRLEVFPKAKLVKVFVVLRENSNVVGLEPYRKWVQEQTGLACRILPETDLPNWKQALIKVIE